MSTTQHVNFDRAYGAILGQAVGDALGAPTEGMTRDAIRARYGWLADFVTEEPAGTDDTEYAVLTARTILRYGRGLTPDDVTREWRRTLVGQEGGFSGGGFSEMTAINNLRRGLVAPMSGTDNHEMWSDGSAMRIAPIGVFCAGDPSEAARLAAVESRVSHARDGIFCAQALAASVSVALVSQDWGAIVEAGLANMPDDSWSSRTVHRAIDVASSCESLEAAVDALYDEISILHYPWADVGPEATGMAYGVLAAADGQYVPTVLAGANLGRDADTIAAMAGAMAGALRGARAIPAKWRDAINVIPGNCITATAGTDLAALTAELITKAAEPQAT
jgi:ADP-ribosylglycohydrolase